MKIGSPEGRIAPLATTAAQPRGEARPSQSAAVEAGVEVRLSTAAQAPAAGATAPDYDVEKVARITRAIAEGRYTVDAGAMADRLIDHTRERLGKG